MKNKYLTVFLIFFLWLMLPGRLYAQTWNFIKEKDGVKLYSCREVGKRLQSFRGVAEIKVPAEKVFMLIEDINHRDWWDKNAELIRLLKYEKYKRAQYYLGYKMHWPVMNRDLCVDATTGINQASGEYRITAIPLAGTCPEKKDLIRIKEYRQVWTVRTVSQHRTQVELEFFVDPEEQLPEWFLNMILIDAPINLIKGLREQIEKNETSVLPTDLLSAAV